MMGGWGWVGGEREDGNTDFSLHTLPLQTQCKHYKKVFL